MLDIYAGGVLISFFLWGWAAIHLIEEGMQAKRATALWLLMSLLWPVSLAKVVAGVLRQRGGNP